MAFQDMLTEWNINSDERTCATRRIRGLTFRPTDSHSESRRGRKTNKTNRTEASCWFWAFIKWRASSVLRRDLRFPFPQTSSVQGFTRREQQCSGTQHWQQVNNKQNHKVCVFFSFFQVFVHMLVCFHWCVLHSCSLSLYLGLGVFTPQLRLCPLAKNRERTRKQAVTLEEVKQRGNTADLQNIGALRPWQSLC